MRTGSFFSFFFVIHTHVEIETYVRQKFSPHPTQPFGVWVSVFNAFPLIIRYPVVLQKKLTDNANNALIIANFFLFVLWIKRPEEKKELRFDPQNKKKEVRNDQRIVCVIRQFFLQNYGYLCCTFILGNRILMNIQPIKAFFYPCQQIPPMILHIKKTGHPDKKYVQHVSVIKSCFIPPPPGHMVFLGMVFFLGGPPKFSPPPPLGGGLLDSNA